MGLIEKLRRSHRATYWLNPPLPGFNLYILNYVILLIIFRDVTLCPRSISSHCWCQVLINSDMQDTWRYNIIYSPCFHGLSLWLHFANYSRWSHNYTMRSCKNLWTVVHIIIIILFIYAHVCEWGLDSRSFQYYPLHSNKGIASMPFNALKTCSCLLHFKKAWIACRMWQMYYNYSSVDDHMCMQSEQAVKLMDVV